MAGGPHAELRVAPDLRFLLPARRRGGPVRVPVDGTSSLGHVVESLGVPLPEVGDLHVAGPGDDLQPVTAAYRLRPGDVTVVEPVARPQPLPTSPPRFLLDVHLGALARRLRLLGLDTGYDNEAGDEELVARANAEGRVLLTRDRGLLRRRALGYGAYVRGSRPGDQLHDVLERFAPPLAPYRRCVRCNGPLQAVDKAEVAALLQPGTRRSYDAFTRCVSCGQVYWSGAHARGLQAILAST